MPLCIVHLHAHAYAYVRACTHVHVHEHVPAYWPKLMCWPLAEMVSLRYACQGWDPSLFRSRVRSVVHWLDPHGHHMLKLGGHLLPCHTRDWIGDSRGSGSWLDGGGDTPKGPCHGAMRSSRCTPASVVYSHAK